MIESGVDPRVDVWESEEGIVVLTLNDSYVNYASAEVLLPRLKVLVRERLEEGRDHFVLNLTSVGVIDSCGLAVLISLKKLIGGANGRLAVCGLSVMIQRLFQLTRLDRVFEIHESVEQAIVAQPPVDIH